jgi:hypothetical protein
MLALRPTGFCQLLQIIDGENRPYGAAALGQYNTPIYGKGERVSDSREAVSKSQSALALRTIVLPERTRRLYVPFVGRRGKSAFCLSPHSLPEPLT